MCPPPCFPGLSKSTKIGDKGAQLPSSLLTSTLTTNKNVLKGRGVSAIQLWDVEVFHPIVPFTRPPNKQPVTMPACFP